VRTRTLRLLASIAALVIGLTATGAFAEGELVAGDRAFYLRGEGCGAEEQLYLSTKQGPDGYDGCGTVGGLPINEVNHQRGVQAPKTFTSKDGVPATLDATRDITGEIRAESWIASLTEAVGGVGQVAVEVTIHGIDSAGQAVAIGSASESAMVTNEAGTQLPFTIDIPDELNELVLSKLTIDVAIHGANFNQNNLGLEGDSHFTLPILVPAPTQG
jgi:hypothetical protein